MSLALELPKEVATARSASTLLVFSDDWGRHPSSCQHLVGHLLDDYEVIWVNTIGTRRPEWNWDTFRRAAGKLRQWFAPSKQQQVVLPPGLKVLNPRMWPYFTQRWDRALNRWLLGRSLQAELARCPREVVAVTTIPLVADLVGQLPVERWVYYCVDDFSVWPGLDGKTLQQMEQELVGKVDTVVAVSEVLQAKHHRADPALLTHGIDWGFWSRHGDPPAWLQNYEPPYIVFWGLIDQRLDLSCLECLSEQLSRGSILLIGPTDNPDARLAKLPRVYLPGKAPLEQLPSIAQAADVLVMPYADLPVTRAMQPLKLKEYLATGKPVVARDLPAVRSWSDALEMVTNAQEFTAAVLSNLGQPLSVEHAFARERLQRETWSEKAIRFADMLGLATNP